MKRSQIASFVSIILVIEFVANYVVYEAVIAWLSPNTPSLILIMRILLGVLTCGFVMGSMLVMRYNNLISRTLYRIFAVWQGFLLYFFLSAVVVIVVEAFTASFPSFLGYLLFGVATLVAVYGLINARRIRVRKISVKLQNLPPEWTGRQAVFVSDVHLGQINSIKFAAKVVRVVNQQMPSIVFIGGDLYDGVKVDTAKIIAPLKELIAPDGIYFVTGNHDGFTEPSTDSDVAAIERVGIRALQNQLIEISGVQIIGVSYRSTSSREKFVQTLAGIQIDPGKPSILLKHIPDNLDVASDAGISLQIAGHTHKAQMWPFSLLTKRIFKGFDYGLRNLNALQVYTSSGVGTWGPPLRVGTQSEIVVITFN